MMTRSEIEIHKGFLLFLAIMYLPSFLFYNTFREHFYIQFSGVAAFNAVLLISITGFLTFLHFGVLLSSFMPRIRLVYFSHKAFFLVFFIFMGLYFCSCLYFFGYADTTFRHNNRLSESSPIVTLLFALRPLYCVYLVGCLLHLVKAKSIGPFNTLLLSVGTIGTALSLYSSLQVFVVVISAVILFKPTWLIQKQLKIGRAILLVPLAAVACGVVLLIGIGNKFGYELFLQPELFSFLKSYAGTLATRMSTSAVSAVALFNDSFSATQDLRFDTSGVDAMIKTFSNRASLVLGLGFESGHVPTVDRLNFLNIFNDYHARAGASPGLIGSIYYLPYLPLGIIFVVFYYIFLVRVLASQALMQEKLNIISKVAIPMLMLNFFEAPLNIFHIFDPAFINFSFFLVFFTFIKQDKFFSL